VVHVEVAGTDGLARPAYTFNAELSTGTGSCIIPLGLNDPVWTWSVVARDVASGLKAMASFDVKQE